MNFEDFYKAILDSYRKQLTEDIKIEVKQEVNKNLWEDYKYQIMDLRHDTYVWRTK